MCVHCDINVVAVQADVTVISEELILMEAMREADKGILSLYIYVLLGFLDLVRKNLRPLCTGRQSRRMVL